MRFQQLSEVRSVKPSKFPGQLNSSQSEQVGSPTGKREDRGPAPMILLPLMFIPVHPNFFSFLPPGNKVKAHRHPLWVLF